MHCSTFGMLLFMLAIDQALGKLDCLIDYSKGYSLASNIYQCADGQKCCLEYGQPSCCASKATLQIM